VSDNKQPDPLQYLKSQVEALRKAEVAAVGDLGRSPPHSPGVIIVTAI